MGPASARMLIAVLGVDARRVPAPPAALERLAAHEPDRPLGVDVVGVGEDTEDAGLGDDSVVVEALEATSRHRA